MAGINRKSIVAEERLLESTAAAKRSTVELTKSILHLTSKIIAQVPKEKFDLIVPYYTEINQLMQTHDDEIEYVMDDIYEELVTKREKGRRIRVEEYMGNIEVKVGGHERFIFEGIAKDKYPEVDEKKGKTSMIGLGDESDDYLLKIPDLD